MVSRKGKRPVLPNRPLVRELLQQGDASAVVHPKNIAQIELIGHGDHSGRGRISRSARRKDEEPREVVRRRARTDIEVSCLVDSNAGGVSVVAVAHSLSCDITYWRYVAVGVGTEDQHPEGIQGVLPDCVTEQVNVPLRINRHAPSVRGLASYLCLRSSDDSGRGGRSGVFRPKDGDHGSTANVEVVRIVDGDVHPVLLFSCWRGTPQDVPHRIVIAVCCGTEDGHPHTVGGEYLARPAYRDVDQLRNLRPWSCRQGAHRCG